MNQSLNKNVPIKINLVVGGTFHLPMLTNAFIDLGHNVRIYTSTPKFKFKGTKFYNNIVFVPMIFQLYRKLTKKTLASWMKQVDVQIFDLLTSLLMRPCDILYGFAGCSLLSGKKTLTTGGAYLLDRACPHIEFQNDLLKEEANILNVPFNGLNKEMLSRCTNEYDLANKIITPSAYTQKTFINKGFSQEKVKIIPLEAKINVPPKKIFDDQLRMHQRDIIFCSVGGGLLRKGYLYLLRAWEELGLDRAKLYIKTSRHEIEQCAEIKEILEKNPSIAVHGYYPIINDFYKKCDILCMPSVDDGFGMVVPEAMANSMPCITTTHVGASDIIKDGHNGFVIPIRSIEVMKKTILYFYNNPAEILRMGHNAYDDYLNFQNHSGDYSKNINELIKKTMETIHEKI